MFAGKTLLGYTNIFATNDDQKKDKIYVSTSEKNMVKENTGLDFRLKKNR